MENTMKALTEAEDLLEEVKEVAKGNSLATAGINPVWLTTWAEVSRRTLDKKEFSLFRYPYEAGRKVNAFACGFFENKMWPIRVDLENQSSTRPLENCEVNYVNCAGCWLAFNEAAPR